MKEEPEILRNIAKEQWAKQRELEQNGYVRDNLEKMLSNLFCIQIGAKSEEELWQLYDKLKENNQDV